MHWMHCLLECWNAECLRFRLFVDNSEISIMSDTSRYNIQSHKLEVDIEGGKSHCHWRQLYKEFFTAYYDLRDSLDGNNSQETKSKLQASWSKELSSAPGKIFNYLSDNPNDVVAARMLFDFNRGFGSYFDDLCTFIETSGPDVQGSWIFPYFKKEYDKQYSIQPGRPAPEFTLKDTCGIPVSLADLKGEVILLDFWAYWCGPCRAFFPELKSLYNEFHDRGFEIIGITSDRNIAEWHKAINEEGLLWIQVKDTVEEGTYNLIASSNYGISGIPTSTDGFCQSAFLRAKSIRQISYLLKSIACLRRFSYIGDS